MRFLEHSRKGLKVEKYNYHIGMARPPFPQTGQGMREKKDDLL